jgi:hypothetical protein
VSVVYGSYLSLSPPLKACCSSLSGCSSMQSRGGDREATGEPPRRAEVAGYAQLLRDASPRELGVLLLSKNLTPATAHLQVHMQPPPPETRVAQHNVVPTGVRQDDLKRHNPIVRKGATTAGL